MTGFFSGFMSAAKEERLRREGLQNNIDAENRAFARQLKLADMSFYRQQKIKDEKNRADANTLLKLWGYDESELPKMYQMVDTLGVDGVRELHKDPKRFSRWKRAGSGSTPKGINWANGDKYRDLFATHDMEYGLPENYLYNLAAIESSFKWDAQNPDSSAGGPFQFVDATAKEYGVTDRFTVEGSIKGVSKFSSDNLKTFERNMGRKASGAELYLAHQQGATGATQLLQNPTAKAADLLGLEKVRLNLPTSLRDRAGDITAAEFSNLWMTKYNNVAGRKTGTQLVEVARASVDPTSDARDTGWMTPSTTANIPSLQEHRETLRGIRSVNAASSYIAELESYPASPERDQRIANVRAAQETLRENAVLEAEAKADPMTFVPRNANGMLMPEGQITVRSQGGKLINLATGEEVAADSGKLYPPDADILSVTKVANAPLKAGREMAVAGVMALDAAVELDRLVVNHEEALNPITGFAAQLIGKVDNLQGFLNHVSDRPRAEGLRELEGFISQIYVAGSPQYKIAQAQLRLAYNIAAMRGSSGQALSDKELLQNLEAIGKGISDGKLISAMIEDTVRVDIIRGAEAKRDSLWRDLSALPDAETIYAGSAVAVPFTQYARDFYTQNGRKDALAYLDRVEGKAPADPPPRGDETPGSNAETPAPTSVFSVADGEEFVRPVIARMLRRWPSLEGHKTATFKRQGDDVVLVRGN